MHYLRRGSLKVDGFKTLATFSLNEKLSILDPNTSARFADKLKSVLSETLEDDSFIYGHRTESMFF
jgi:hypothetical protein